MNEHQYRRAAVARGELDPGPSAPNPKTPSGVANTSDRNGVRGRLLPSRTNVVKPSPEHPLGAYSPHTRSRQEIVVMFATAREQMRGRAEPSVEERKLEARVAHRQARIDVKRRRLERQRARRAVNAMRAQMKAIARRKATARVAVDGAEYEVGVDLAEGSP